MLIKDILDTSCSTCLLWIVVSIAFESAATIFVFKRMNGVSILSCPGLKCLLAFGFLWITKSAFTFLISFLSSLPDLELNESIAL